MIMDFTAVRETMIACMSGGTGVAGVRTRVNEFGRFSIVRVIPGSSIGERTQAVSESIGYVVSGRGFAMCDDDREELLPGSCHICPKGSSHSVVNDGTEDLVLFAYSPSAYRGHETGMRPWNAGRDQPCANRL